MPTPKKPFALPARKPVSSPKSALTKPAPVSNNSLFAKVAKKTAGLRKGWGQVRAAVRKAPSATSTSTQPYNSALYRNLNGSHDTLGDIFAKQASPCIATAAMGALDNTEAGQKISNFTGGWLDASTAVTIAGTITRGFGADKRYLGRHITRANTHLLTGMLPVIAYKMGARIPDAVKGRADLLGRSETVKSVSGVESRPAPEPIPGEVTMA